MDAPRTDSKYKSIWQVFTDPAPEPPVMVDGLLRQGSNLVIAGTAGVRKSTFASYLGLCLATGKPVLSMKVDRPYNVYYIDAEMDEWTVETRLRQQIAFSESLEDCHYYYRSVKPWSWHKDLPLLLEQVSEQQCEVLVLDPLSRIKPSDVSENDNDEMGKFLNEQLNSIVATYGLKALVLVHHFGKPSTGEGPLRDPIDMMRGASTLRDWMENFIHIGGKKNGNESEISFDKLRGFPPRPNMRLQWRGFVPYQSTDLLPSILGVLCDWEVHSVSEVASVCGCSEQTVKEALAGVPMRQAKQGLQLQYPEAKALLQEHQLLWAEA